MLVMKGPLLPMRQICVCNWNGLKVQHWEEYKKKKQVKGTGGEEPI